MMYIATGLALIWCLVFYPIIYIFGFVMAIISDMPPHKTAVKCINDINKVFEV